MRTLLSTAIRGPYGLIVGFQLVIGLIDLWANSQRKAKEETDKVKESINEEVFAIIAMYDAYKKMNPSTDEARKLKKRLSDQLKVNVEDYEDLGKAVDAHIKLMDLMATATEVVRMQEEELAKQRILNKKLLEADEDVEKAKERLKLEGEMNKVMQAGEMGTRRRLAPTVDLNYYLDKRQEIIDQINSGTTTRLQLEQKAAKLQEEINKLTKEGNEEDEKKKKNLDDEKKSYFNLNEELQEYLDNLNDLEKQLSDDIAKKDRELYIDSLSEEQQEIEKIVDEYDELIKRAEILSIMQGNFTPQGEPMTSGETAELIRQREEEIDRVRKEYAAKRREERRKQAEEELKENEAASKRALDRIHQTEQAKLQAASNTFGFLIALNQAFAGKTEAEQRKAFNRDKALRVAQATIDTYAAANAALASGGGTP